MYGAIFDKQSTAHVMKACTFLPGFVREWRGEYD